MALVGYYMAETEGFKKADWCLTQTKTVTKKCEWAITNFSFHVKEVGYFFKSSIFSSEEIVKARWFLKVFPKGISKENENEFIVQLHFLLNAKSEVTAKFKCSLINSNTGKVFKKSEGGARKYSQKSSFKRFKTFVKTSELEDPENGLLPNDTLTIKCEVTFLATTLTTYGKALTTEIPPCNLKNDLFCAFEDSVFSDLTLIASGKQFKVHRFMLAARAPILSKVLMSEMEGKYKSVIELKDVDPDGLNNMLHFIYTGDVLDKGSTKIARNLLKLADNYNLERLKVICEETLSSTLTMENVLDLLASANLYRAKQLKKAAFEFIHFRMSAVMKTEEWLELTMYHPRLSSEVLSYHLQFEQNICDTV